MKKTEVIIDINDIQYNYKLLRKITKQGELCIPVVKANAYGFNYYDVVENFLSMEEPQKDFFIYSINEGCDLREQFGDRIRDIYCITGPITGQEDLYYKYNIIPVINSVEQLHIWSSLAKKKNEVLKVILQFNLGLNRSGLQQSEIKEVRDFIYNKTNNLELIMVMGHLAFQYRLDSDLGRKLTKKEFDLFENAYKNFPNIRRGLLGTEGILKIQEGLFEFSRPGTVLYVGQPEGEKEYVFKTSITVKSPVFLSDNRNYIYINFGINQGLSACYENRGYVYIDGEQVYAKKVEMDRTYFVVNDNEKYKNKTALLLGYSGNDYIDGYLFSKFNGSVPEEAPCKIALAGSSDLVEYKILNGLKEEIKRPKETYFFNRAVFKGNKLKKFTSVITEIRVIEEDGACGYGGRELVKKGEVIATFPVGYADGLDRKLGCNGISIYLLVDGRLESFKFCGGLPMDQMCFKVPLEFKDKVKVGDEVIIVDEDLGIGTKKYCEPMNMCEEELFFMASRSNRNKVIFE